METQECINIYENIFRPKFITFPGCAYMDDTGFITNNKLNLERILKIADSFYKLNNIKINKQKSELLLRKNVNKKNPLDKKVNINFGQETIEIEPTPCNQSSRFLGVWINAYTGITDKMMIYLFNSLIIPIIEYRTQLHIIEDAKLDKLMAPFRMFIKNKLKFAKTTPNAILETNFIYNLNNFVANQKQAKITNFVLQMNAEVIQIIKRINNKKNQNHFIRNIELLVENNFSILRNNTILSEYSIEGGPTVLRNILSKEVYIKNFKFFKDNNIIFLDQITTLDKKHILSIEKLETRSYVKLNRKKKLQKNTKFYQKIIEEMTISRATYSIKSEKLEQIVELDDDIYSTKGTVLFTAETMPNKGATVISKISRGRYQNRIVFGKIVEVDFDNKIAFLNHFENTSTEKEKSLVLKKCEG
ncbi:hypothetical protein RhiirC2_798395, partial [Rhizophagus irregularis]